MRRMHIRRQMGKGLQTRTYAPCNTRYERKSLRIEAAEDARTYGINKYCYYIFDDYGNDIENIESKIRFSSRKEATLAAIDAALEYLVENKLLK